MNNKKYLWWYLVLILISSIPLFTDFLIRGHDIYFHLMRIEGLAQGMRAGQFPVRIQPAWYGGYGYAVSVFYSDLFLYPVAFLRMCGLSLQVTYKSYVLLCNTATVLLTGYCFGKIFEDQRVGVFSSCLYTLAPYRLVNLYTRGAVGEYTGMVFWPLLIYSCVLFLNQEKNRNKLRKGAIFMGISMAGMLQSHILTAEIACMVLLLLVVIYWRYIFCKEVIQAGCIAVVVAIGLSAWFIVPFLDYMMFGKFNINSIQNSDILIQRQGTFFSQVFAIFDNAIGQSLDSGAGTEGDFAQGVGLYFMLALVLFMVLWFKGYWKNVKDREKKIAVTAAGIGLLMTMMSTLYFPWDFFCRINKVLKYIIVKIQFPWRFTGVAVGAFVLLWCAIITYIGRQYGIKKRIMVIGMVIILVGCSTLHFMFDLLQRGEHIQIRALEDMDSYVVSGEEYLPVYTVLDDLREHTLYQDDGIIVSNIRQNGIAIEAHVSNFSSRIGLMEFPRLYYTGYDANYHASDGQNKSIRVMDGINHVLTLQIPTGIDGDIILDFNEPWYWHIAEIITLLSTGIVVLYTYRVWKREKIQDEKD